MRNNWNRVKHTAQQAVWDHQKKRKPRLTPEEARRIKELQVTVMAKVKAVEWMAKEPDSDGMYFAFLEVFVNGERMTIATKIYRQETFKKPIRVRLSRQPKKKKVGDGEYFGAYRFPEDLPRA